MSEGGCWGVSKGLSLPFASIVTMMVDVCVHYTIFACLTGNALICHAKKVTMDEVRPITLEYTAFRNNTTYIHIAHTGRRKCTAFIDQRQRRNAAAPSNPLPFPVTVSNPRVKGSGSM